jgi:hypothetical protein
MGTLWSYIGIRREVPASKIAMFLFVEFSRKRDGPAEVPLGYTQNAPAKHRLIDGRRDSAAGQGRFSFSVERS